MKAKIEAVKKMFSYYGFINCPLSHKEIVNLIKRQKTIDEIYQIGCDNFCQSTLGHSKELILFDGFEIEVFETKDGCYFKIWDCVREVYIDENILGFEKIQDKETAIKIAKNLIVESDRKNFAKEAVQ